MTRLYLSLLLILHISMVIGLQDNTLMPGDAVLAGLLEVTAYEDGSCGKIIPESVQTHEAVRWLFRQLNERDYIPGVTLGFHAFQTCGQPARATHQTFNILDTYMNGSGQILIGLLGPKRSSETQPVSRLLSSLPEDDRLPQISYSATADALQDRSVYKNLFRVIQPDKTQVEVIIKLMQKLNWNYIGVIYEDDACGRGAAEALKILAEEMNICTPVFVEIAAEASTLERKKKFTSIANLLEKNSESQVLGAVFFGQGSTAEVMFQYIDINFKLENFQLIVSESLALDQEYVRDPASEVYSRAKGLLTPIPPYYDVDDFQRFWKDLHTNDTVMLQHLKDNDWLRQYLDEITNCKLGNVISIECLNKAIEYIQTKDRLPMYIPYALLGAATFAKAVKDLHSSECGSGRGICEPLRDLKRNSITETIKQINVSTSFDFDPELSGLNLTFGFQNGSIAFDEADELSTYDIYNFQNCGNSFCFKRVGTNINNELSVALASMKYFSSGVETQGAVEAQCQSSNKCGKCTTTGHYGDALFTPGDFYIIGFFPIHNRKSNSLECGNLRDSTFSVDIAEAAHYAVRSINQRTGVLKQISGNTTIGLILLDTCVHSYVTLERLIAFNTGMFKIKNHINSSEILDKVIGYIGPAHSSVTVPFGSVMNEIHKVYISYSATSSSLSNRQRFPYFMRASSPDHKQANVIMELAQLMDSNYVQIVYSDEEYGKAGRDSLLKAAKERKICVAQSLPVPHTIETQNFQGYISDIRKYPYAKIIVVFLLPHMFPGFLGILNNDVDNDEFAFIGSEGWAQREELLVYDNNVNTKLRGSFSITQQLPKNKDFETYYKSLDVLKSPNPWLQNYIEARAKCFFPNSFNKQSGTACTPTLIEQQHQTDTWAPFTINTVYALALGFHAAVSSVCGGLAFCPEYSTKKLIEHIKNVHLDIYNNNNSIRVFDENGEGNVGYTISQIVRNGQRLVYKEVGLSSENTIQLSVSLESLKVIDFASECTNPVECSRCSKQFESEPTYASKQNDSNGTDGPVFIGLVTALCILVVILLIVCICIVCRWRKKKPIDDPYLTVIPSSDTDPNYDSLRRKSAMSQL